MTYTSKVNQGGQANAWMIATICLIIVTSAAGGLAIWSFMTYNDQKTNINATVETAVSKAKKDQADIDEAKFLERDKEPNRQFVGPDDYGRVTFNYPKTWSVYVDKDASDGGDYEAYLNPVTVPTVSSLQQFALRVMIEQRDYDKVVDDYSSYVKSGDLKSSSVTADGNTGTRLDGKFSSDIRGSLVLFKIRDKTLTIRTDAATFKTDFDALITTIKFNK